MIRSYFNATAEQVKKKTGINGYGAPEFELVDVNVDCRKIEKTKLVRNDKGNEVLSSIEVWLPPDFERLPPQSVIIFDGQDETIITSGHIPGISENLYLRLFLQ